MADYPPPEGLWGLRLQIADYLAASKGILADPDHIIITAGTQESLSLIAAHFLDENSCAVHESPGYTGFSNLLARHRAKGIPVPVDQYGLRTDQLPDKAVQLAFVTPSHQYPLGHTLTVSRRQELLAWASSSGALIIEDDYDGDFCYGPALPAALKAMSPGQVIYLGSFSKTLGPGLRLGYMVCPPHLSQDFIARKALLNNGSPWLTQAVLARFFDEYDYPRHLQYLRRRYMEQRNTLLQGLKKVWGNTGVGQGLIKVRGQIDNLFDTHGDTQLIVGNAHESALLGTHFVVNGVGNGQHQTAVVAQMRGQYKDFQAIQEVEDFDALFQHHAHQATEAIAEQLSRTLMLRVILQARILHVLDLGMGLQMARQRQCVGTDALHTQRQGFRAYGQTVSHVGRQGAAHIAQALFSDLHQAPVLRIAVAVYLGNIGIGYLCTRIGNGFNKDHTGIGLACRLYLGQIGCIHQRGLHTQIAQGTQEAVGIAEQVFAGNQVIALTQQGKQGGTQGSHASCKADAAYPFFHACNLGFQRRRGRRALAGISKAGLALKDRSQLTRILKPELGRRVQWLMNSAMLRAQATAFYCAHHGDGHQLVAGFTGQTAHALALGTHYPGHGAAGIYLVEGMGGLIARADQPDIALAQHAHDPPHDHEAQSRHGPPPHWHYASRRPDCGDLSPRPESTGKEPDRPLPDHPAIR
uniref:Aminotran_1_2 domain-containing protein n=1 Tax=Steinernema glaseri TaxID=37863 RepID=A0A1I8AEQ0_9BILA